MKSKLLITGLLAIVISLTAINVNAEDRVQVKAESVNTVKAAKLKTAPVSFSAQSQATLRPGTQGAAVFSLQEILQKKGYYNLSLDGKYGPGTRAAVARFQAATGLSADGVAGARTFAKFASSTGFTLPPVFVDPNIRPTVCTLEYAPVCGQETINCVTTPCTQPEPKTYGNSCGAKSAGVKVLYEGECKTDISENIDDKNISNSDKRELIVKYEAEIKRMKNYIDELEAKIKRIKSSLK